MVYLVYVREGLPAKVILLSKGWGRSAKLKKHSRIWGKFGTAIQGYILNPCTKFAPNPTSRKVNNQEHRVRTLAPEAIQFKSPYRASLET